MKKWFTQAAAGLFALAAITLTSCDKDEDQVTLTPANLPTLSASTNTVVLQQANSAQTAVTYTWTPVSSFNWQNTDNPYAPTVSYVLQVSTPDNSFGAPASIPAGNGPTTAVTVEQLNTALTTIGVTPGTATPVQVRLATVINSGSNNSFTSAPVALTATGYTVCLPPNSDRWSIIGPAGVDWNTDVPLTYNCDSRTYKVTRVLNAGEFKFRLNNDWGTNYGSNTARNASGTGPLNSGGNNITVPTTGTYTITLNLATMTYTLSQ
ncbi:SusE domain-containing protein [Hymenobacter sp. BT186]|uniref:SusE domain-containing protein n=1 Tax=Hymenobacter telluris TaxID=2816474 RepID=A0A939ES54_9BACT|nr:SusE domain-containing protein [Hymenobacter telluris]MBO0356520.1 SusE domain-containing protein [Hymenobacter telluris]MBW3372545.1 SusE domain-containing protein [Hymenobacter norwichensis]